MKIVSVGKDELSEWSLNALNTNRPLDIAIDLLVYAYENGGYDGSGVAVYSDNKGNWHLDEFSHCSCNGPLDGGFNAITYTKEQIFELLKKRSDPAIYGYEKYLLIERALREEQ